MTEFKSDMEFVKELCKDSLKIQAPLYFTPTAHDDSDRLVLYFPKLAIRPDEHYYEGAIFEINSAISMLYHFSKRGKEIKYGLPK